jgi:hypothetical protein
MVVIGILSMVSTAAAAQPRVCGDGPVLVKAAVGQAVEIVVENGVGDLVRSGDPATLKVEHTSGHLFLTPLSVTPAQVTIIDMRGRSHVIRCVFDQPVDQKIVIGDCVPSYEEGGQDAVMVVMRDLIRGRTPDGAAEQKADMVMFDDGNVRMTSLRVYQMLQFWGYVMVVENLTPRIVAIPVQQMSFPGLLAVFSSKDVLAGGEKGKVYMVVGR